MTDLLCDELPRYVDLVAFASGAHAARRALMQRLDGEVKFRGLWSPSPACRYELWHRTRRPRIDLTVDVCHAPSLAVPPTTAPLVVSINDVAFLRHPETFTRRGVRFHERGLTIARREAAAIIVPSRFTRDELVREGFDAARIHCVPLAPATHMSQPSSEQQPLSTASATSPYILIVGTVEPRKNHRTLLAAFRRLRTRRAALSLVIVGAIGWLPSQEFEELSRPGVLMQGPVTDAELDALYRNASIVVSPSVYEGFDLPMLEAMARGRPVVASDIPVHAELAGDAARLVEPRDIDAWASAIDELLSDKAARDELGQAALRRAQRFTVEQTITGHLATYEVARRYAASEPIL